MTGRWVAFLRAINTGNRRVTGDRLVEVFESLGFERVSSFLASGNVLFSADSPDPLAIEEALRAALGYEVATVLRSGQAVGEIASTVPFAVAELEESERRIQVILLRDPVPGDVMRAAWSGAPAQDLLRPRGGDVFWLPRTGISDSALDLGAAEKQLGAMTIRAHNTIKRLAARL